MRLKSQIINKVSLSCQPTIEARTQIFCPSLESWLLGCARRVHASKQEETWISREFYMCVLSFLWWRRKRERESERYMKERKKLYYNLMLIRTPKKFSCLWASASDVTFSYQIHSEFLDMTVTIGTRSPFRHVFSLHIFFIIKNLK